MKLGSHSRTDCLVAELFLNSCLSGHKLQALVYNIFLEEGAGKRCSECHLGIVFAALFRTAVERASCGVHKLLRTGPVPMHLLDTYCFGDG